MKQKIRKAKKKGKIIIGYKEVLKNMGKLEEVLMALNCPERIKKEVKEKGKAKVKETELTNMEIGEILGKPFSVSCLGIKQ